MAGTEGVDFDVLCRIPYTDDDDDDDDDDNDDDDDDDDWGDDDAATQAKAEVVSREAGSAAPRMASQSEEMKGSGLCDKNARCSVRECECE